MTMGQAISCVRVAIKLAYSVMEALRMTALYATALLAEFLISSQGVENANARTDPTQTPITIRNV